MGAPGKRPKLLSIEGGLKTVPPVPITLPPDMEGEWNIAAADLQGRGLLSSSMLPILETYFISLWTVREAKKSIAEHGVLIKAGNGALKPNPSLALFRSGSEIVARLSAELGLSALSRSRTGIRNQELAADSAADPFDAFDL
ncbi:P27 family phage terminase small subunit [Methylobrevis albus]|uniref:P27 family phage terminase small subunit n=1 Tax=Methylobrevis albus TaxID=2793297 RepID=A0A931MZ51_9HYPH|nr:P27 family phage terminase small subunit [Methylobrevis albus]MBH0239122.1 P27 family phage terminase small subunit [Methylobrevis albus]